MRMKIALAVILGVVFLAALWLDATLRSVSVKELRRRARQDKSAAALYKLAAFGHSSELLLRLIGSFCVAGLVLVCINSAGWIGFVTVVIAIWLAWSVRRAPVSRIAAAIASLITPVVSLFAPMLRILSRSKKQPHTQLYDREDLVDLLKNQRQQVDNRIPREEIKIAENALSFSDKKLASVMIPRRKVKWVAASDAIGPMVMDELHKTGFVRFPVTKQTPKSSNPAIVGSLYLKDLLEHLEDKGHIRDIMQPGAGYINESQNLLEALNGFLKTGQNLLVVVNNFEEVVGVLTLEDVLKQIFGNEVLDKEFDSYHDLRAVASQDLQKENSIQPKTEVE